MDEGTRGVVTAGVVVTLVVSEWTIVVAVAGWLVADVVVDTEDE